MSAGRLAAALLVARRLSSAAITSTDKTVGNLQTAVATDLLAQAAENFRGSLANCHASCRGIRTVCSQNIQLSHPYASIQPNVPREQDAQANVADNYAQPLHSEQTPSQTLVKPTSPTASDTQDASNYTETSSLETNKVPHLLYDEVIRLSRAGAVPELTLLFRDHAVLHQKHIFNNALLNLPASRRELVPLFYNEIVTKLGIQPSATAVAKVMRVLGKLQRESEAKALWRDWLDKGYPAEANVVAAYCGILANLSHAEGVESVIEQAKAAGLPPIFAAYTALIRAWGQRRQMVKVRQVLLDMKEDGVQPNELHYRAAIHAHAQNARPHEAEYMIVEMKEAGILPASQTYAMLMDGYAVTNQPRKAAQLMQDCIDDGHQPTLGLCNTLIKAWAKTGEPGEVRAVMMNMRSAGLQPDIISWGGLLHAHAKAVQPGKAAEVMRELSSLGLRPGVVIYTTLLNAYGVAGDVAAAHQVLRDMRAARVPPNNFTYSSLMAFYSQAGNVPKILALQKEMKDQGLHMDAVTQLFMVEAAMESWSRSGRPLHILAQAEDMFERCSKPGPRHTHKILDPRHWQSVFIDLHYYGYWSCQLALLAGLRRIYTDFCQPGYQWPTADLVVSVGKGTNSVHRHQSHVRDAVLHFLQHLVPVKLAAGNDGLVTVRRLDMLKVFEAVQSQQQPFNAATFVECFTARQQEFGNLQDLTSRL
ncbi:hypothetical protein ABBQ38_009973 [Trebouxia sp. C0009 RCD-2024]